MIEDGSVDDLVLRCKNNKIPWLFFVRNRSQRIKIRSIDRKHESEISRGELAAWVERHLHGNTDKVDAHGNWL